MKSVCKMARKRKRANLRRHRRGKLEELARKYERDQITGIRGISSPMLSHAAFFNTVPSLVHSREVHGR